MSQFQNSDAMVLSLYYEVLGYIRLNKVINLHLVLGKVLNREFFSIFAFELAKDKQSNGNKHKKHEREYNNKFPHRIPCTLWLSETKGDVINLSTAVNTPAAGGLWAGTHFNDKDYKIKVNTV